MAAAKATHGGTGRGQGRKPMVEGTRLKPVSIKMSEPQHEKLRALGGAEWVRSRIDRAKLPLK
jgi:hypothetical protein